MAVRADHHVGFLGRLWAGAGLANRANPPRITVRPATRRSETGPDAAP